MSRSGDMAALREQVQAGHLNREGFVANLAQSCIDVGKTNQAANRERKRSLMETLAAYMKRLAAHEKGRIQEASRLHKTRVKFVSNLARSTAALRKVNAAENTATRIGWFGAAVAAVSPKRGGWSSQAT